MRKPEPLPRHLAQRPFTVEDARRAGLTAGRTRARDLWTPSREIRLPCDVDFQLLDSCRVHTAVTRSSVVSHITAAKIHGLYLPGRLANMANLDLARRNGEPAPRRRHVNGHRLLLDPSDINVIAGVPVTAVQRTLIDIAPLLSLDELVVIGDQIVCEHLRSFGPPKFAMVRLPTLNAYIAKHAGLRGMRTLREAMELVRVGADSPPETRLRLIIVRSPLPDFEPNLEIQDEFGNPKVAPDLVCPAYKTCAEYDGIHHFSAAQQAKDHDRNFITEALGWHQVLVNNDDMRAGELVVVTKLARMLVRGGWPDRRNLAARSLRGALNSRKDFA